MKIKNCTIFPNILKQLLNGSLNLCRYKPSKDELKMTIKTKLQISYTNENTIKITFLLPDKIPLFSTDEITLYQGDCLTLVDLICLQDISVM